MNKEWSLDIKEEFDKKFARERAIFSIVKIRDEQFQDSEILLSCDDMWNYRPKYNLPKDISALETILFSKDSDIDNVGIFDKNLSCSVSITFGESLFIIGDESFYNKCIEIWKKSINCKLYNEVNVLMDGTAFVNNNNDYQGVYSQFLSDIKKHNAKDNTKALVTNKKEFLFVKDIENFHQLLIDEQVKIIINCDVEAKFYTHLDFIWNHWAVYTWK